jgi:two-component system, cell cycle response regulator DivK
MSAKRILVADDNAASRELIREVLEMSGYDVIEASDGAEALSKAVDNAADLDLVLVDIQMPRLDGYGVLREMRRDPRLASVQVVALTAFAMEGDRERAVEAGFDGYITKPVEIAALRREIAKFF